MKKVFFILIALIIIALTAIYVFIPGNIRVNSFMTIQANKEGLVRKLGEGNSWAEWWPGEKQGVDSVKNYTLNGITFKPDHGRTLSVPFSISTNGMNAPAELTLIGLHTDSATVNLETQLPAPANPLKRISAYFQARKIKKSFSSILLAINNIYNRIEKLYGYDIQKKTVVDSTLVFTSETVKGYPDYNKIYSLIEELKSYIQRHGAGETGFPMLNIFSNDNRNYLVKVAIPVDKKLPDSGRIGYRWMLGGGNILITEVRGGQHAINKAYEQILHYISDYQRTAPAIPFESLVTDRRKEPDSSKWITRIYYPVM